MGGINAEVLLGVGVLLATAACGATPAAVQAPLVAKPDPNAEIVRYCAGTVTEWDEHRCIWELTPEQQRHRSYSQRLTIRGGKLLRFETVTGSGALCEGEDASEYQYEGSSIASWSWINRNGVLKGSVTVSESGDWVRWLDAQGRPRPKKGTKVSGLRRNFDARGRVLGYVYVDASGNPARYSGDVFEKRVKLDQSGAVIEETFFGQERQAVLGPTGAHRVAHQVDAHGSELERRYFDADGQPMQVKGVGIVRFQYDAFGNPTEIAYFRLEGQPTRDPDEEAATVLKTRDQHGNELERQRLDELGKPVVGSAHGASRKMRYDEQDLSIEFSYFGADGAPVRPPAFGYAIMRQARDARGNVSNERFFDETSAPTQLADGYHRLQIDYDARDNPISYRYTDVTGAPVMVKQGYQARRLTYDGDRLIRTEFLDLAGKLSSSSEVAYAEDGSERQLEACHGTVPQELVEVITARAATTRTCYERLLASAPDAGGKLAVGMHIEENGKVTHISMIEDSIGDAGLASCVTSKMLGDLPRGPDGGCAEVNVPLKFQPKKSDDAPKP